MDIFDEFADLERPREIAQRYGVGCEASLGRKKEGKFGAPQKR